MLSDKDRLSLETSSLRIDIWREPDCAVIQHLFGNYINTGKVANTYGAPL